MSAHTDFWDSGLPALGGADLDTVASQLGYQRWHGESDGQLRARMRLDHEESTGMPDYTALLDAAPLFVNGPALWFWLAGAFGVIAGIVAWQAGWL